MPIQWYPGHMHATHKALAKRLPEIDVVIELLDARLPGSSSNPLLAEMTAGKPSLKVLNKQDLADPAATEAWLAHFNALPDTQALALDAGEAAPARRLLAACRSLAPQRGGMVKPLRVLICGVPNVGKSTLVNTLLGTKSAKTGDEPGITKTEQRIPLASDAYLYDTPGMLWPRIVVEQTGIHLAAAGSIGRNAYDEQVVALGLIASVRRRYAERLAARYKQASLEALSDDVLLAEIARRRGGLVAGGQLHLHKGAEAALNDFRNGAWGRITLEWPEEFMQWLAEGQQQDAERQAQAAARQRARRGKARAAAAESADTPGRPPDADPPP